MGAKGRPRGGKRLQPKAGSAAADKKGEPTSRLAANCIASENPITAKETFCLTCSYKCEGEGEKPCFCVPSSSKIL